MPKPISWRKFVRKLKLFGFIGPISGGKHPFMVRGTLYLKIPNPYHGDISKELLSEILRQAGIAAKDWLKLP